MRKENNKKKLIVIVGPTASGKSTLAVHIAKRWNGEVVSADSRQVYRGLDIGSGKITKREMQGIPHHLLDITNPKETFTVAEYQKLARETIEDIWERGKLPIICGGTGLYIQAVVDGIVMPEVKPNLALRRKLEKKTAHELFALLKKKDLTRAKTIDPHNSRRLIRALEIIDSLGKVPKFKKSPLKAEVLFIGVKKDPSTLNKLLHKRILLWLRQGLDEEIRTLAKNGLTQKHFKEFGLVYMWGHKLVKKKIDKDEFVEKLFVDLWHYAKRQMTWFKRDPRIHWIAKESEALDLTKRFLK